MGETSLFYLSINRGKHSIVLDLKQTEGREIFLRLAATSDVIVEGFRPGTMERLGLGYDDLKKVKPELVYCAISGYGQNGPFRNRAGHDLNYLAISGILGLQSSVREPTVPPIQVADLAAGSLSAAIGILVALEFRRKTGHGTFVDISMLDGLTSLLAPFAGLSGESWIRNALLLGKHACYNIYGTRDGKYLTVACIEPKFWSNFCRKLGLEDWIPLQFEVENTQEYMRKELQQLFAHRTSHEWREFFQMCDACVEIVLSPEEMEEHPQVIARDLIHNHLSSHGELRQVRAPIRISGCDYPNLTARMPGEDTDVVLATLGYSANDIEELRSRKVIR